MNVIALRAVVAVAALAGSLSACGSVGPPVATGTTTAVPSTTPVTRDAAPLGVTRQAGSTAGTVKGASGALAAYLATRAAQISKVDGCSVRAVVTRHAGRFALGRYRGQGCGGETAIWAKGAHGWTEVYAGQEALRCADLEARAPGVTRAFPDSCHTRMPRD